MLSFTCLAGGGLGRCERAREYARSLSTAEEDGRQCDRSRGSTASLESRLNATFGEISF